MGTNWQRVYDTLGFSRMHLCVHARTCEGIRLHLGVCVCVFPSVGM